MATRYPPTLQVPTKEEPAASLSFKERVELLERELISDALKQSKGNVAGGRTASWADSTYCSV